MSRSLWILLFAFSLPLSGFAESSSSHVESGPTSAEEARVLWTDSQADFQAQKWEDAIPKLERFIARYPGYPGTNEAPLFLARAYLQTRQPAKAKPLLKDFILAHPKSLEGAQARVLLIRTRLVLQENTEALLATREVENIPSKTLPSNSLLRGETLVLKARALIALKRDTQAQTALKDGLKLILSDAPASLRGEASTTRLDLKLRECARFPSAAPLDEAAVRHQLERRGTCLLEAVSMKRETTQIGDNLSTEVASGMMSHALAAYLDRCQHPPAPPKLKPKDRSPQQLETYYKELRGLLEKECGQVVQKAADLEKAN